MTRTKRDPNAPRLCAACREETPFPGTLCLPCGRMKQSELPAGYQLLTTSPDPMSSAGGPDAGQRGWRLHVVKANDSDTPATVGLRMALCGKRPSHGWSIDRFIDTPCAPCLRALLRSHPAIMETRVRQREARAALAASHAAFREKLAPGVVDPQQTRDEPK